MMDVETAYEYGRRGDLEGAAAAFRAECEGGNMPKEAAEGRYKLGTVILVSRDSIGEGYANPNLPQWFPARVCLPPDESGNWYRWYDPFIWYETEGDLSSGGKWCTSKRNMAYVGKLWYSHGSEFHRGAGCYCWDFWAVPVQDVATSIATLALSPKTGKVT